MYKYKILAQKFDININTPTKYIHKLIMSKDNKIMSQNKKEWPKILCECGLSISKTNILIHKKLNKHSNLIERNKKQKEDKDRYNFVMNKWEEICDYCRELEDCENLNFIRSQFILLFLTKLFILCGIKKDLIFKYRGVKELCLCGCFIIRKELKEHQKTKLHINKINKLITKDEEYDRIKKTMLLWTEIIDFVEFIKKNENQNSETFDIIVDIHFNKIDMCLNSI